jgi:peroxiredoxin/predicted 2-oxoglutarate/Fe(II)-dependent dioxygenase YbiX
VVSSDPGIVVSSKQPDVSARGRVYLVMEVPPLFQTGDPIPWFKANASDGNPSFDFSTVAGRYVVLCFFGSAEAEPSRRAIQTVFENRGLFDDRRALFFGVSVDRSDRDQRRVEQILPGIRYFWDFDREISRRYRAVADETVLEDGSIPYRPYWLLVDPMLRVVAYAPLNRGEEVMRTLAALPPVAEHAGVELNAPVLILPRVFEPAFCRRLIDVYNQHGGEESGYMIERDGKTEGKVDHKFKRRKDCLIEDEEIRAEARRLIARRLAPEIRKAFQYGITRIERYIVACYEAETGGYFRPHRDDTMKGTAHRRFAVTINLNAEEFEGGELRFPEFGPRTYRAPTGGAVVFSCTLLHEATPVTAGKRFAFLPFLYDDAAAKIRLENQEFLADGVPRYTGGGKAATP